MFNFYSWWPAGQVLAAVAMLLGALPARPALAQSATFAAATTYSVSGQDVKMAIADVNVDGFPDILTVTNSDYSGSTTKVLLGTGTGAFQPAITYSASYTATDLVAADINADGLPDLVSVNSNGPPGARVLLGNGDGTFQPDVQYPTGPYDFPTTVAVADVNSDNKPDIVLATDGVFGRGGMLKILPGNGDGTFQTASLSVINTGARSNDITVADVSSDGKPDIIVANEGSVGVLLGNGNGTFQPRVPYATATGASYSSRGIAVADVNSDGQPDLFTTDHNTGTVNVLLGTGAGLFAAARAFSSGAASEPEKVAVADVNGDGRLDVLTANFGSSTVGVLLGTGTGSFEPVTTFSSGASSAPNDIFAVDVNQDGLPDLLTANYGSRAVGGVVGVLLNTTGQAATLTGLSPTRGPAGTSVTFTGTNLGGATEVRFNGTPATTFAVVNATTVTATVPAGATSGPAVVATPGGVSNGLFFTVTPDLVVNSATSIAPGSYRSITVMGTGTGTLAGDVVVDGPVVVQAGGTLFTNCQSLTGAGSFTLAAGATLGICDPLGIAAAGASGAVQLTGARSFSPDAGYVYNGTAAQATGTGLPGQVRTLTVDNANRVTLSQGVAIARVLTLSQGVLAQPTAAASVTLLSDAAAGTALIVNAGGLLEGNTATVQLTIEGSTNPGLGYRHLAPPVLGATISSLATAGFSPVVNSLYNTQGASVQPFPTVYYYDESRLSRPGVPGSGFDIGWVSPTDLTNQFFHTVGYTVQLPATVKLSVTGGVFTGGIGLPLTRTGSATDAGWNLVGNPYPSPINWDLVRDSERAGLDAAMYVFESTSPYAGRYRSYANGIGSSPVIPLGQAFFVRVSAGQTQGTMTFNNTQRVTTFDPTPVKRTAADPRPQLALSLRSTTDADATYLYQEAGATAGVDAAYDAVKLPNTNGLNLSQVVRAANLAINGLPILTAATSVPLAVGVPGAGTYTLAATALSNLPAGLDAYLYDAQTGLASKLAMGTSYVFSVTAVEAQTLLTERFRLQFNAQTALAATAPTLLPTAVSVYPNPAHDSFMVLVPAVAGVSQVQVHLSNSLGQVVRTQRFALPVAGVHFTVATAGLSPGVYVLHLQAGASAITKSVVIY